MYATEQAISDGVELFGYRMWGCLDLVSAATGQHEKIYCFIYVNRHDDATKDYQRYPKNRFIDIRI
ncbi:family 1 glycosylhydrolase [Mycoplasmopsis pullorum]|uniref:family 1 glycosylhydrolase n=1 Tax=Mycoplasmopsis pullorum TaxID=48003 RepID=UPI001F27AC5B